MTSPVEQVTRPQRSSPETPSRFRLVRYFGSALLVRTADEGARVALVLLALDRVGDAAMGGVLVAALLVPHVVAAPVMGRLVDTSPRPGLILATSVLLFASGLALSATLVGRAPIWAVVVVLALAGCGGPAITGGLTSRLGVMLPEQRRPRAFGLDSLFYNVASMAGPAGVAIVGTLVGADLATVGLAGVAALGAVGILSLRLAGCSPESRGTSGKDLAPRQVGGFSYLVRDRPLRNLTATTTLGQLGPGALAVVATVLATNLDQPEVGGLLLAAVAAGSLIGSLLWTCRPLRADRAPVVTGWSMIGIGIPLAISAALSSDPDLIGWTAVLFGVSGLFIGPFAAALFLARNQLAPSAVRAQVFTIGAGLKVTASAAGAVLIGLVTHQPVGIQLLLVAAAPVVAGTLNVLLLRRRS